LKKSLSILLLSQARDQHVVLVSEALQQLGAHSLWCDLASFPEQIRLTAQLRDGPWTMQFASQGERVAREDLLSICNTAFCLFS
jgi:hypothetical protein